MSETTTDFLGKPSFKKTWILWKTFTKWWPPPRIVFVKSLFRFFYRKFRDKIKVWQNSVNHSKFRFSTRLMQGITQLHYYQTHQGILFWPKTCHFELLNFWIRVWKQTDPPPRLWKLFIKKRYFLNDGFSNKEEWIINMGKNLKYDEVRNLFTCIVLSCTSYIYYHWYYRYCTGWCLLAFLT